MINIVAELSAKAVGKDNVFVATENKQIADTVTSAGFTAIMTDPNAATGTDRVAEACLGSAYDIIVNVQGDEPLLNPDDILKCIEVKKQNMDKVVNGFTWIGEDEDPTRTTIPKVITNEKDEMIYMSRSLIPGHKGDKENLQYKKQVCVYGFTKKELADFFAFGRKSVLEEIEDIEILRFLEIGKKVLTFECESGSLAVDVPEDVDKVIAKLQDEYYDPESKDVGC